MRRTLLIISLAALAMLQISALAVPPVVLTNIVVQAYGEEYVDYKQPKQELFAHELPDGELELRIGDGETFGGQRVSGTTGKISLDETMLANGHEIKLNQIYSMRADYNTFNISAKGDDVFRVSSATDEGIVPFSYSHTAGTIYVRVTQSDGDDPPSLEYTTDLVNEPWTDTQITPTEVGDNQLVYEWPIQDRMFFFRVRDEQTSTIAVVPIPLSLPNGMIFDGSLRTNWPPPPPSEEWYFYTTNVYQESYTLPTNSEADTVNFIIADPDDATGNIIFPSGWIPDGRKTVNVMWTHTGPPFGFYVGTHRVGDADHRLITLEYLPQFSRWLVRANLEHCLIDRISFYNPATDTMSHTPYD